MTNKEYNLIKKNYDIVFLDEIQFMDHQRILLENVEKILNEGILMSFVLAWIKILEESHGKHHHFSLGLSDKITKIYGFCNVCGLEATKTYRKEEGGERTQVGAANIYEPRCLKHWKPQ